MNAVSIPGSEEFEVLSSSCIEIVQAWKMFQISAGRLFRQTNFGRQQENSYNNDPPPSYNSVVAADKKGLPSYKEALERLFMQEAGNSSSSNSQSVLIDESFPIASATSAGEQGLMLLFASVLFRILILLSTIKSLWGGQVVVLELQLEICDRLGFLHVFKYYAIVGNERRHFASIICVSFYESPESLFSWLNAGEDVRPFSIVEFFIELPKKDLGSI
ncbi:hypothetical protein AVEN_64559-1 [Araneus ventricosus]|uniref:Uncharacterized protein n=1 Tax=Araneus ventricosus TaxID=182803 RepID=A0A4Y2R879_ARAVE|nr:hypothetical protein AVEN_64559-1 [Araneus ventricosus]